MKKIVRPLYLSLALGFILASCGSQKMISTPVENIDNIDFMKMDVEGKEFDVLSGESFKKVSHKIKSFVVEYHTWTNASKEQFISVIIIIYRTVTRADTHISQRTVDHNIESCRVNIVNLRNPRY